ncbi:DedA family protein [Candidatus Kaiserbacteria bacterium]|nr:DedA family protein [Candidatus Kaiserbacteria bacterium]
MDPGFLMGLIAEYTYIIIAPAALALGPIVGLAAGVLLRLDVLALIPTCLALATGELGGDILWYWLGRRYGDTFVARFGRYVGVTEEAVSSAKKLFENHHDMIIFSSKLTSGLGFGSVIMFTAGLSRVPFRRYMMLNIAGQFLWTAGLISIGYFLGHIYLKVGNAFEKVALFALIVLIVASLIGFGRYLRNRLSQETL